MATKKKAKKKAPKKAAKKSVAKKKKKKAAPAKAAKKKKATAKKAAPAKKKAAPAKKKKKARKPIKRRDATGHLDQDYARDLRRSSQENVEHDDDRAFLVGKNADDATAQELGREFVETVTSGEDEGNELRDQFVSEEIGGPFVTTTGGQELAEGTDESNPEDATREPFPKT
jgi:hypothetical protein